MVLELLRSTVLLLAIGLATGAVQDQMRTTQFVTMKDANGSMICAREDPSSASPLRSSLQCATSCLENDDCDSYNFDADNPSVGCQIYLYAPRYFVQKPNCRYFAVRLKTVIGRPFCGHSRRRPA